LAGSKSAISGRSSFLALKSGIEADLVAGAYAKTVHAKYQSRLGISYRQFLRYLKEYESRELPAKSSQPPAPGGPHTVSPKSRKPPPAPSRPSAAKREPIVTRPGGPRRFVFNPADINPDKLI
jgi:hypothetical protein